MKNSEHYFNNVQGYFEDMAEIAQQYAMELSYLERFKGSAYYDDGVKRITAQRAEAEGAMYQTYWPRFQTCIKNMRDTVNARKTVPPTQDQLATLQALKMRSKVSIEELRQAARTMQGCPLALSVLDDIAHENGHPGARFNTAPDKGGIMLHIDNLEKSAKRLLRKEGRYKRAPKDLAECMTKYGIFNYTTDKTGDYTSADLRVDTAAIAAFCEVVDG